jgi:hypothetical protein
MYPDNKSIIPQRNNLTHKTKTMKKLFALSIVTLLFAGMIQAQEKTTLNVKDLNSGIEK